MVKTDRRHPWEWVVLAAIVALAAWLRLRKLDLVEFKLDEMNALASTRDLLDGHLRTTGLLSSVGALNPPLFLYLLAIPLGLWNDPLVATAFVALSAIAAVGLTGALLRPRFGALAGFGAAALFATAPWAVLYGRKIWAQDMLPLFTVGLLWSLFVVLERPRTRAVFAVPVLACLAFQLNFSAIALGVPVLAVLLYRVRVVHRRALVAGLVAAVLLLAPWIAHEMAHGYTDLRILITQGQGDPSGNYPGAATVKAVRETLTLVGGLGWADVAGADRAVFAGDAGWAWTLGRAASWGACVLVALGLFTSAVQTVRGARRRRGWPFVELAPDAARRGLLVIWLAGAWLAYLGSSPDRVFPHYLIMTYPVSFAVQALGVSDSVALVGSRSKPGSRLRAGTFVAGVAVPAAMMLGFVAFTVSFHSYLGRHHGTAGDYGVVYDDKEALAKTLRARGLRADDPVVDFLVAGRAETPPAIPPPVAVRDTLVDPSPLACDGVVRTFGALEACLPRAAG